MKTTDSTGPPDLQLPLRPFAALAWPLTWVLAGLLVASSGAGLLLGPQGWYDETAATYPALLGQDALALALGVPVILVSARRARRGSIQALLVWLGTLFYVAYFWSFYVVGIRVSPLLPVHVGIVSISMYALLLLMLGVDAEAVASRFTARLPRKSIAAFLVGTSIVFAALWLGLIASRLAAGADVDAVLRLVVALDGVVLLPLMFFGGLWLWRRLALGFVVAALLLVKSATTFLTLIVTTGAALAWGQSADPAQTTLYVLGFALSAVLLTAALRAVDPEPGPA